MQFSTRIRTALCCLAILFFAVNTSVVAQTTTITFDDQGYVHNANLGRSIIIGNFEFSVTAQDLSTPEFDYDIYYESASEANGFGGSGLIYVGDQFDYDDPYYFIIKTVDGTAREFQSFYIYDYITNPTGVGLTVEAYRDGTLLGSQDLTIPASSKATYTLGSTFDNVDEIRIRQQTPLTYPDFPGVVFAFDQFIIGSPVVANTPPTVTGLPALITITEDEWGDLDIASSSFADAEDDEITVSLSVSAGRMALSATGGRPVELGGNNSATVTVTGKPDAVNGYLDFASNIRYIPPANLTGSPAATLTVSANDGSGEVELGTVPINITAVNDAPVAVDDELTVDEDTPGTGNVLTNDSDPEGNALTASLVTAPVNGTVVLNADGSFTYTPNANYVGPDSLIYQVCDNGTPSLCDTATLRFDIVAVNNAPTNIDLSNSSVNQDAGANTVVGTLTSTDPDDGDTHTYSLVTGTGDADNSDFNIDGSTLRATNPSSLSVGTKSVRIRTTDNDGGTYEKSFTITVAAPLPCGWAETQSSGTSGVACLGCTVVNPLQAVDGDSDTYSEIQVGVGLLGGAYQAMGFAAASSGSDVLRIGISTGVPLTDASLLTGVTFTLYDGNTQVMQYNNNATFELHPAEGGNPAELHFAPNVAFDSVRIDFNALLANVSVINIHYARIAPPIADVDQTQIDIYGSGSATFTIADPVTGLTYQWYSEDDNLLHTGLSYETPVLSETTTYYVATVNAAGCEVRIPVEVRILPPAPPEITTTGGSTTFTEPEDGDAVPTTVDPGLTVSDPDNSSLTSATVSITGNFQPDEDLLAFVNDGSTMGNIEGSYDEATGVLNLTAEGGTATLAEWQAALRAVTYSNRSQHPSTADRTISFVVNDGTADSAPATKTVNVVAVNTAPVAVDDAVTVYEDIPATGNVLTNDSDVEGNALTASLVTAPVNGTVVLNADGSFTYTPNNNYNGQDSVRYQVCDNGTPSLCDTAWLRFALESVNDAPVITAPAAIAADEDLQTPITGISFSDADAGAAAVTATFSVASGILSATSGSGVTVGGSETGSLTMIGTIADLNAFIAASSLNFTTALNATSNVTLTVSIDDGGHTGADPGNSGTDDSESATTTITLAVTAINDAPVNTVPEEQTVDQDGILVFSTGNGNEVSISDVDVGGGTIQITLTATNGLIALGSTTGLTFISGSGAGDGTTTFEGSIADINTALNGLTFVPTSGYNGAAGLQIITDDLGLTGSGGSQTDTDVINITVNLVNPVVISVGSTTPDGLYKAGRSISLTVTFDQPVTVDAGGGSPSLLLETGDTNREAEYVSGSGSNMLAFNYSVQPDDVSADLDYVSTTALALNGATIRSSSGTDAVLTLPAVGSTTSIAGQHDIVIEGIAPMVTSVDVPANGYHVEGDPLDFIVHFSEEVTVDETDGFPYLEVTIGTAAVQAAYMSGSGSNALAFRYVVQVGDVDMDGISVGDSLMPFGGPVRDAAGNWASLALTNVGLTDDVLVYTAHPGVVLSTAAASPVNGAFTVTVTFSEAVTGFTMDDFSVTNAGLSDLQTADNITYTILVTPVADGGVSLSVPAEAAENIASNGNTASNALSLTYDGTEPVVTSVDVPADSIYRNGNVLTFTVHYSEDIPTIGGALTLPVTIGGTTVQADLTDTTRNSIIFSYTVQAGELDTDGVEIGPDILLNGGALRDDAGNDASLTLAGASSTDNVLVDAVPPVVTAVDVPADGYYREGDVLLFTVHMTEDVTVNRSGGTPYLEVTVGTTVVRAGYTGGSGTDLLTFSYTVQAEDEDLDGIGLGGDMILNGGTLQDIAGNGALLTLHSAAPTDQVFVYSVRPTVTLSTESASPVHGPFSVTAAFSEAVTGFTEDDISVTNGTLGDFQTGDNLSYTFRVTPGVGGVVQLSVAADVAVNIAANGNVASNTLSVQFNETITGVALEDSGFVYDGTEHALTLTGELPVGTSVVYEIDGEPGNGASDAGTYEVTALIDGGDSYEDAELTATLTITPLGIAVTAEDQTKVFGMDDPALTYTFTPALVGDDTFTGSLEREAGEDVGDYAITQGNLSAGDNYTIRFAAGSLVIRSAVITGITLEDGSFVYDGMAKSLEIVGELPEGTSVNYGNNRRTDAGTQEVTATVSGDNYETLVLEATLTIRPGERSIDFPPMPAKTYGDEGFEAGATSSSGEVVSYTSSDPSVAEVDAEGLVTIHGAGTTAITATVPANGNYSSRPEMSRTLVVGKSPQTIEFAEVGEVHRDAGTVELEVSASSELPVSLSVDDPEVATVEGSTLHIHRLGTVRITATQDGDSNHEPAEAVTVTVRVVDPEAELPMRVSKVVSPNGDGINEYLIIEGIKDYPENKVTVFNRNGTVLYEVKGYNNGSIAFRGISTGQQLLSAGTYFYVAEIRVDGQWKYEKGWFVLRY